jgi:lipid-A-disaccharide synthase
MRRNPTILITCGEASGDLHAANLITQLLKRMPDARIVAFGGDRVAEAGADVLFHIKDYAIIGFSGVITNLPRLAKLERGLKKVLDGGVDLFIPVDYPGLNIRLATHAKRAGVPVLYYISPQVWAWGQGRIKKIANAVDKMAVILPFEESFFKEKGIPAEFVGHPLVEDHVLPCPSEQDERSGVGLLPGSRTSEVRRILPILLGAAEWLNKRDPDLKFSVGRSPWVPMRIYKKIIGRCSLDVDVIEDTKALMARSRLLLVASGTATLEAALCETPLIIVYRLSVINYMIARWLIKIRNVGLVNIILGEEVCPEFIQADAKPDLIAEASSKLLGDTDEREKMVAKFKGLRKMLTANCGSRRVAELSEELLDHK